MVHGSTGFAEIPCRNGGVNLSESVGRLVFAVFKREASRLKPVLSTSNGALLRNRGAFVGARLRARLLPEIAEKASRLKALLRSRGAFVGARLRARLPLAIAGKASRLKALLRYRGAFVGARLRARLLPGIAGQALRLKPVVSLSNGALLRARRVGLLGVRTSGGIRLALRCSRCTDRTTRDHRRGCRHHHGSASSAHISPRNWAWR